MKVVAEGVSKGRDGAALPLTSVSFESGTAMLVSAETAQRPSVLGLIASGRMRPDTGTVTIDDVADAGGLRDRVALVDAPDVSEPESDVTVFGVVAEELMFAGRAAHPRATRQMIADLGFTDWRSWTIGTVPPAVRIRILTELAVMRLDVEGVVITAPDRHGGDPEEWWGIARDLAERGYAVLVIAGDAARAALGTGQMTAPGTEPEVQE
ncbi:hypothetical protein [Leifsonia sp. Root112D2]|uniref:hypothetical protein n=1 Tax=Leifsonia sp. Root112D2 TaxID=1736426 RepID=UPI0006F6ECDE|nr:hypothetical protein [Leifsonia sp. Root112D2]KQV06903.1 hypothetical protein ASC63_05950 [Leifsonia sp. Root112D2]